MKKITLFGTRHYQTKNVPPEIQKAMEFMIDKIHPQIVLEEWSESQIHESATAFVCKVKGVPWKNIGTPKTEGFTTYDFTHALDFPDGAKFSRYGPILNQKKREDAMRENIIRSMSSFNVALVVLGLAHLHSMYDKLSSDFDVTGFTFASELF